MLFCWGRVVLVLATGAVVAVVFGSDVPLNTEGTAVARVGSESSEELLQAEAIRSNAPVAPRSFAVFLNLCTSCYYTLAPKAVQEQLFVLGCARQAGSTQDIEAP